MYKYMFICIYIHIYICICIYRNCAHDLTVYIYI